MHTLVGSEGHADWWVYLESMNHALGKVLDSGSPQPLNKLDKERLGAVNCFIRGLQDSRTAQFSLNPGFLASLDQNEPTFLPDVDFEACFRKSAEFQKWQSGLGFDRKIQRLLECTESFLSSSEKQLFAKNAPKAEFRVLKDVIDQLLAESECFFYEPEWYHDRQ